MSTGRVPALDGIRGIAIVLVIAYHLPIIPLTGGYFGVDVFFVLSGFLITSLLLSEHEKLGRISLRAFYVRRALRLLPALGLFLVGMWAGMLLFGRIVRTDWHIMARATLYTLVYMANWVSAFSLTSWPSGMDHLWSLSVEEQFYIVWPTLVVLALTARVRVQTLFWLALTGAVVSSLWRAFLWSRTHDLPRVYFATDTRADGLLAGCALALALAVWPLRRSPAVAWIASLVLAASCVFDDYGSHSVVAVATAALILEIVLAADGLFARLMSARWLTWLGARSYGLYLWHLPIFFIAGRLLGPHPVAAALVAASGSLAVTSASWSLVEQPALRLKARWGTPRAKTETQVIPLAGLNS